MPSFPHPGLCCCLSASSTWAMLSWAANGPVPPQTPARRGVSSAGLAGKSRSGPELGAPTLHQTTLARCPDTPHLLPRGRAGSSVSPQPSGGMSAPRASSGLMQPDPYCTAAHSAQTLLPSLRPPWGPHTPQASHPPCDAHDLRTSSLPCSPASSGTGRSSATEGSMDTCRGVPVGPQHRGRD